MRGTAALITWLLGSATAVGASGCLVAAAGAGAGGAVYVGDRGVESVVAASVDRAYDATVRAFRELGVTEGKSSSERDGGTARRELEGSTGDRNVTVKVRTEGAGAHVEVVAYKSAVTWDKDFARRILERIVALAQ
jgi:hypothetical protein